MHFVALVRPSIALLGVSIVVVLLTVLALKARVLSRQTVVRVVFLFVKSVFAVRWVILMANIALWFISEVIIMWAVMCFRAIIRPLLELTGLLRLAFLKKIVASLNALLDAWVVRKHAPFSVLHSNLPFVKHLLFV